MEKGFLENDYQFMNRLNRMSAKAIAEANLEDHFDIDLSKKNATNADSNITDILDNEKAKKKHKKRLNNLKRKEKKFMKQNNRLLKIKESRQDFGFKKDSVQFGDVAHQPPIIKNKKLNKNKK